MVKLKARLAASAVVGRGRGRWVCLAPESFWLNSFTNSNRSESAYYTIAI